MLTSRVFYSVTQSRNIVAIEKLQVFDEMRKHAERKRRLEKKAAAASSRQYDLAAHNGVRREVVCRYVCR